MRLHMKNSAHNIFKKKLIKKITSHITVFAMLFQITAPAIAATLPDNKIEVDLNSDPQFERVFDGGHQFVETSYIQGSDVIATDLQSFYNALLQSKYVHVLGEPNYVPIMVDDIVTIIPTYEKYKLVGTSLVQSRYVRSQLQNILGRTIIDSDLEIYKSEAAQLNTLYTNAITYINANPSIRFGDKLGLDQAANGFTDDFIWPELREINAEQVIVPVVYLTAETYGERLVDYHAVQFNGNVTFNQLNIEQVDIQFGRNAFLNVADDLIINQGELTGDGVFQIAVGGTLKNNSGAIRAISDLKILADKIDSQTIVHRYDHGNEQGGRFGEIASFESLTGDVTLTSYSDILLQGTQVSAEDGGISFAADGSIYIGVVPLYTAFSGGENGWTVDRSSVEYLQSSISAEDSIKLIANGEIVIDAAEIVSDKGHIEILAGLGITIEDELSSFSETKHGKFGKRTKDTSVYQTVAIRSLLDAGKGVRLHSELGDITLQAADITSTQGTTVNASNGAVNLLLTTETDHYSYSRVTKGTFTTRTHTHGHDIKSGVNNTIVGGFAVEALSSLSVEYVGDPKLSLDDQVAKLAQMEGLGWMADVRANSPDADWTAIEEQYNEWDKSTRSLSPAFAAVVSIAIAVATSGASAGLGVAANSAAGVAISAGTTALIAQGSLALTNGALNGDIRQAMRDFASEDTFKSLATAMITAGAIAYMDGAVFFEMDTLAGNAAADAAVAATASAEEIVGIASNGTANLGAQAIEALQDATIRAGVSTVVNGGNTDEFMDQFVVSLAQQGINSLGKELAQKIGGWHEGQPTTIGEIDTVDVVRYISHAATGCLTGTLTSELTDGDSTNDSCLYGAGGAVIGEAAADIYSNGVGYDDLSEAGKEVDTLLQDALGKDYQYLSAEEMGNLTLEQWGQLSALQNINGVLSDLKASGVDIARLSAAMGSFVAGAEAYQVNIAADAGENAAENNALFIIPIIKVGLFVWSAVEVYQTLENIAAIIQEYNDGLLTEERTEELMLQLSSEVGMAALALVGAKKLETVIEFLRSTKVGHTLESKFDDVVARLEAKRIEKVRLENRLDVVNTNGGTVNQQYLSHLENPPFTPYKIATEFTTKDSDKFVRVYSAASGGLPNRRWMMRLDEITDSQGNYLSPEEIKNKFALPDVPDSMVNITIPTGQRMIVGEANDVPGWGHGGGEQYYLQGNVLDSWYDATKIIGIPSNE